MTALIIIIIVLVVGLGLFTTISRTRRRSASLGKGAGPTRGVRSTPTSAAPRAKDSPTDLAPTPSGSLVVEEAPTGAVTSKPGAAEIQAPVAPRLADRLGRAREALASTFSSVRGRGKVDQQLFDELEEALIIADVGLKTTSALLDPLRAEFKAQSSDPELVLAALKDGILSLFDGDDEIVHLGDAKPSVWLFVGVNGVGKTTTIGKLARREIDAGHSIVLAAGDTFRAAAGEQLGIWAERTNADIVQGADGADPSSVIFDAIAHAAASGADLVLADTAGRLHNKANLMEELKKIRRIADRPPGKVTEVLLVIDATTGQNGLAQAREFSEAVGVTGVVLTKLDGSAKGGIVLAIRAELGLPIKLVGLGEGVEDLVSFSPREFADALFS
jgi:fused signal recognition particle receptor